MTSRIYVYAGFRYSLPSFLVMPGQHPAAAKERHVRAAREQYEEDATRVDMVTGLRPGESNG